MPDEKLTKVPHGNGYAMVDEAGKVAALHNPDGAVTFEQSTPAHRPTLESMTPAAQAHHRHMQSLESRAAEADGHVGHSGHGIFGCGMRSERHAIIALAHHMGLHEFAEQVERGARAPGYEPPKRVRMS